MKCFVVSFLCLIPVVFGQTNDTIYVPLHLGNKWQYIRTTVNSDGPSYSLISLEVTADTIIHDSIYYKMDNGWYHYSLHEKRLYVPWNDTPRVYIDFSVPDGNTYQSFRGNYVTVTSETGTNQLFGLLRPYGGYLYIGSNWGIRQHYTDSIGLTYEREALASPWLERYKNIIAAILIDSSTTRIYTNGYKPEFGIGPIVSTDTSVFDLNFNIQHQLTRILPPGSPPWHSGLDFIDTVKMISYYSNGDSTVHLAPLIPAHPSITSYRVTLVLDTALMKHGYSFYYRFTATDKCIIPAVSFAPDSGYYKCDWLFPTGVDQTKDIIDYSLAQNYPNPFNPNTTITYALPVRGTVKLIVYDALGREVRKLVDEEKDAGMYEVEFNTDGFASGIYVYRLSAGEKTITRKMVLLK